MPDRFWIFIVIVVVLRIAKAVRRHQRSGGRRTPAPPRDWTPTDLPGDDRPAPPPPAPDTRSGPDTPSEVPAGGDAASDPGPPDGAPGPPDEPPVWPSPTMSDEPTWPERDAAGEQGPGSW